MGDGGTIMSPTSEQDVFRQAQILALRQVGDQQAVIGRTMEKMADTMTSLREDMASLKAQNVAQAVERLETKLDQVQAANVAAVQSLALDTERKLSDRDRTQADLLAKSLDDRKALWLAVTDLKGKVIPLFALLSAGLAAIVAVAVEKLTGG